jgi:hypothetical protein
VYNGIRTDYRSIHTTTIMVVIASGCLTIAVQHIAAALLLLREAPGTWYTLVVVR